MTGTGIGSPRMLVLIGAKENHGPFGQKFNGSERTVALGPEPGAGSRAATLAPGRGLPS